MLGQITHDVRHLSSNRVESSIEKRNEDRQHLLATKRSSVDSRLQQRRHDVTTAFVRIYQLLIEPTTEIGNRLLMRVVGFLLRGAMKIALHPADHFVASFKRQTAHSHENLNRHTHGEVAYKLSFVACGQLVRQPAGSGANCWSEFVQDPMAEKFHDTNPILAVLRRVHVVRNRRNRTFNTRYPNISAGEKFAIAQDVDDSLTLRGTPMAA